MKKLLVLALYGI